MFVCALSNTQAAEIEDRPEGREADTGSVQSDYEWPRDGGAGADGVCWKFWGGGWAYSRCNEGASREMNPAWPLPATDLDAHVSLDVIASGIAGTYQVNPPLPL